MRKNHCTKYEGVVRTVVDMAVLGGRAEGRDDLLDDLRLDLDRADERGDLRGAVREEVGEGNERREEPDGEEREDGALDAQCARGTGARGERGDEERERGEGEETADDGEDVAGVEHVAGVDGHGRAGGHGALELVLLVDELDEGVDADAHADDAKGEGQEERGDAGRGELRVRHGGARRRGEWWEKKGRGEAQGRSGGGRTEYLLGAAEAELFLGRANGVMAHMLFDER